MVKQLNCQQWSHICILRLRQCCAVAAAYDTPENHAGLHPAVAKSQMAVAAFMARTAGLLGAGEPDSRVWSVVNGIKDEAWGRTYYSSYGKLLSPVALLIRLLRTYAAGKALQGSC